MIALALLALNAGPSFDCAKAAGAVDRRVCADPALAASDVRMAQRYGEALKLSRDPASTRAAQRRALQQRDRCADSACVARWYDRRIAALQLPMGACVDTRVDLVGPRLEGLADSGSSVAYADGRGGVSYTVVTAVAASRPGDPIRLCLVSRPLHCPPGDDRGAIWRARNGRTGASWTLPDSEHQCGGA